jgi:carbohydrate kinase (thermoresistant glucokinase family)
MGRREFAEVSAFIVMGVSGCGKSSVAGALAARTGGIYLDADDFHPPANKAKMAAGHPLTDDDRWGWLDAVNAALRAETAAGRVVFTACSALKQVYRDRLATGLPALRFIYLKGSKELIRERLSHRANHFMPPALLDSQFATLEEPTDAITVSIDAPLETVVEGVLARLDQASDISR